MCLWYSGTGCLPVSEKVKSFRLRFFGHLARSAPEEDHHRVIAAVLRTLPDWRRPVGRPRSTWLTAIYENFGVHTAWRKAKDRDDWHQVVTRQRSARSSPPGRRRRSLSAVATKISSTPCLRKTSRFFICYNVIRCHPILPILGRNILQEI